MQITTLDSGLSQPYAACTATLSSLINSESNLFSVYNLDKLVGYF